MPESPAGDSCNLYTYEKILAVPVNARNHKAFGLTEQ